MSDWRDFEFAPIDLARGELRELVTGCDVVYHLAAEPGVRASWGNRFESYVRNNVLATQHLLEAVRAAPVDRFVYASSSSIYGQATTFPTREDALPRPHSPYGVTKLAGEHLCQLYCANHDVPAIALRYFTVYGPKQRPDMAFNRFCSAAVRGEPIEIYGDGRQSREFTFVADVVRATRAAAESAPSTIGGAYNIGGGSRSTLLEVIRILEELAGVRLDTRHVGAEAGDVRDTEADTGRAFADLAFSPTVSLREGLETELRWMAGVVQHV